MITDTEIKIKGIEALIAKLGEVQAERFIEDSRDSGFEERVSELDSPDGIWSCQNFYQCTRVCPRHIKITLLINKTKEKISQYRTARGEKVRSST